MDADDLVQETLTKALANLDKYRPGTRLKSWLFTIMRNTFCTNIKAKNREIPSDTTYMAGMVGREATQEWSQRGLELSRAVENLPLHYRAPLMLVTVYGRSYSDTAKICDCAVGTVKSRLSRARHLVADELQDMRP